MLFKDIVSLIYLLVLALISCHTGVSWRQVDVTWRRRAHVIGTPAVEFPKNLD